MGGHLIRTTTAFLDLVRIETRLYTGADQRLRAEHGLSLGQFEIMSIVERIEDCRVADIMAELAVTVGAVSKAVDRLEAAGRCRRLANPHDGRSSILELTPQGRALLAAARPTLEAELVARTAPVVPTAELARAASGLAALRAHLEAQGYGERRQAATPQ